jgi:hypothetical protein
VTTGSDEAAAGQRMNFGEIKETQLLYKERNRIKSVDAKQALRMRPRD